MLALNESRDLLQTTALAHEDDEHGDAAKKVDRVDGDANVRADLGAEALASEKLVQRFKSPGQAKD